MVFASFRFSVSRPATRQPWGETILDAESFDLGVGRQVAQVRHPRKLMFSATASRYP